MRGLGRTLVLMLLAAGAVMVLPKNWLALNSWEGYSSDLDEEFQSVQVFWLEPGKQLSFELPANARQLRVALTPRLSEVDNLLTLDYQLFDSNGRPARQFRQTLNSQAEASEYVYAEKNDGTTDNLPSRFFDHPRGITAGVTQLFFIDIEPRKPYSKLRIEMPADNLQAIALRVSSLEERSASQRPVLWQRLHQRQQEKLVEDHIYPLSLVPENERYEALRYEWRPIGPGGVEDVDYHISTLFTYSQLRDFILARASGSARPVVANSENYISFFRSEEYPVHSLECQSVNGGGLDWLNIRYQTDSTAELSTVQLLGDLAKSPWILPPLDGLYEVKASSDCMLKLTDSAGSLLQRPAHRVRGDLMLPDERLRYPLAIDGSNQQPLRVDLRQVDNSAEEPANSLEWVLLDANNQVLTNGYTRLPAGNDPAEQLPGRKLAFRQRLFITAPASARYLELRKNTGNLLVTVFNRPLNLPLRLEIQEGGPENTFQTSLPRWFPLAPVNDEQLEEEGKSTLIHWHYRLGHAEATNTEPGIWQELRPRDHRGAFTLLAISRPENTTSALDFLYRPLVGDQPLVHLKSGDSRRLITPALVYRRNESSPRRVRIAIGNLPPQNHWLVGRSGRLQLPELPVGKHRIRISGAGETQWLCNFQETPKDPAYLLREVAAIGDQLEYIVEKTPGQRVVSLDYFPTKKIPHTIRVKLLHGNSNILASGHSYRARHFTINPPGQAADTVLLDHESILTGDAMKLVIPLADDLPEGSYALSIDSTAGDSGFVRGGYYDGIGEVFPFNPEDQDGGQ